MNDFFFYLVESSVCLAIFYLVYWVLLKRETFFNLNRFFLVSSVGFSLVIPLIRISSPIASRQLFERIYALSPTSVTPAAAATQASSVSIFDVLLGIYLLGVGLMLFRFCYKLLKVFTLIKKNGVQRFDGLKVVFMETHCSPFSFFNFVFIDKARISDDDFQRIIAHEMIHIKQYHSIDLIILELLAIFQWFNPFVWPYRDSLKETHEYLADYAVIAQGCNTARYQLLIFEQHVGAKLFEFANNFNQSQIKRRITMITKGKSKRWARLKVLLMLPMICFLVLAFADSKAVGKSDQSGLDSVKPVADGAENYSLLTDDSKKSDEKKKAKLKEIETMIKELKMKYEKTDDEETKKKIKEKVSYLQMEKEKLIGSNPTGEWTEMEKLRKLYEQTDDPKKKKEIAMKIAQLEKKIQMKEEKKIEETIMALKKKYEQTDDPELKKQIEKKIQELKKKK